MKTRRLGSTDLNVTTICLGTMQFGWTADEDASFEVMDAYVAAGGNFIDTADIYSRWHPGNPGGVSEEIIGSWMKSRRNRDSLVVATKVRGEMWGGPDGEGLSRKHIERAVDDSLRRLGIEAIDLYQCHWPDEKTPIEETLRAFDDLVKGGKVRHIGASNYNTSQLREALDVSAEHGLPAFATLQPHYNLVHRAEHETNRAALCVERNIGVIPYSPLAAGFLTGKYKRGEKMPQTGRRSGVKEYLNDHGYSVVEAVSEIAAARGTTPAAVALAWLLAKPAMVSPIIGANSPEQLADLLPAVELELSGAEIEALDAVSATS